MERRQRHLCLLQGRINIREQRLKKKCSTPFVNYNVFVACKTATRQPHKIFFTVNNYDKQFSTEIKHKSTYALRTKYCNLSTGLSNGDDTNIELPHILMI